MVDFHYEWQHHASYHSRNYPSGNRCTKNQQLNGFSIFMEWIRPNCASRT